MARNLRLFNEPCKLCGVEVETVVGLTSHIKFHGMASQDYYDLFVKKDGEGFCVVCGKETSFVNFGYKKCCSLSCSVKHIWTREDCRKAHSESRRKLVLEGSNPSIFIKGQVAWNRGLESPWTSKRNIETPLHGDQCSNWRGGISFELYGVEYNKKLRREVLERDNYECKECGAFSIDIGLCCHHIDYNKKNNVLSNLITLCVKCHPRTNFNRDYWRERYMLLMQKVEV